MFYTVKQGDWLSSIAKKFGIGDWKRIYDHPKNKEFKEKRPDPNVIYPGDKLFIPEQEYIEIEPKRVNPNVQKIVVSDLEKETIQIIFKDEEGKPVANQPYKFKIGGYEKEGTTDGNGKMIEEIEAKYIECGTYSLFMGGRELLLNIGHLDPVNEITGIQARLDNLGYDVGPIDGIIGPKTKEAIKTFQRDHGLKDDGIAGPKTQDTLKQVYGC